ncbi:MAG TPA: peptide ABC transporter substrate-binding protein [Thermomicrobiales bacterium]|nr:peptide ABC transporter substrate-binding protein [Thermomicrobiales bacterium]
MANQGKLWSAWEDLKAGRLSRRQFIERATALGVGMPVIVFCLNALGMSGGSVAAQSAPTGGQGRPSAGTDGQTRGAGDELKILLWQAPTHLSPHTGNGTKDYLAASFVSEGLMSYLPDATVIANLVKEVPSFDNGLLAKDLSSVTYNLLEGVKWSDGEPFTSKDVLFTWQWITRPENGSVDIESYKPIKSIDTPDDLTVKITFNSPTLAWYVPFTGTYGGNIYPGHLWEFDPTKEGVIDKYKVDPVGTGPYKVESFKPNDQIVFVVNENYREPNKPYFAKVNVKGGGEASAAARAVLQTGDWDYAWNLQVEPAILNNLAKGGKGQLVVVPGTQVERILFNFANPNKEVEGQRAYWKEPHPVFTDKAVRQAMSLAADRKTIATQFYGEGEPPTSNILVGIPAYESKNTSWEFDVDKAKQILDDAGWKQNGDTRSKDGVEMKFTYSTSINSVRQKTQQVFKQACEDLGIKLQLKQVDAGTFFDSGAGNEQTYTHFYNDLEMYTSSPGFSFPTDYMLTWFTGQDGSNMPTKENGWSGQNLGRYSNADYDKLYEQVVAATDPEKAADLFIQMNDLVINDYVIIPLVQRAADKYAISNRLNNDNVALGPFESNFWNVQNWVLAEGQS